MRYLLADRVFDGDRFSSESVVCVDGKRIHGIIPASDIPSEVNCEHYSGTLAPGFIDAQVNGGGGIMFNNAPTAETLRQISLGHRLAGTTGLMPTIISDTPETQRAAANAVSEARTSDCPGILGIHIEGPFFDPDRRGTHKADMIRKMDAEDLAWLASLNDYPVVVTLAPEHTAPGDVAVLSSAGINVCAGHTNASYEQIETALNEGLRGFTHLFNAMSPLTARAPGTVGAALDSDTSWVGIIADGHHVHPASIRIAQRSLPEGKLMLVSDSMSTVGTDDTSFELYGERIRLHAGKLVNAEGALAGSAIGMNDAIRYCHREVGISLDECLRMASLYPAAFLKLEGQLGRIAPGYRADLVLFDDDINVSDSWVAGQHMSHPKR
ncbi:MAG: N-acetylglucosamine-6-phosphate deacetylase [Halioglobus sp.]